MISGEIFFGVFAFILGACAGSFMNVCIWRLPRNESIVTPPSHCPRCNYKIRWFENIPLISWICLRAKCSNCRQPISARYIAVESLVAVLFALAWFKCVSQPHSNPALFLPLAPVIFMAVTTIFTDIEHRIIPDEITFPVLVAGLVFAILWPLNWELTYFILKDLYGVRITLNPRITAFMFSAVGLVVSFGAFAIFAIVGKRVFGKDALGWGDVKYMGALGACLGLPAAFFTALAGSILGTLYGLLLMLTKKAGLKTEIPFGPFLSIGTLIWIFFDDRIIRTYFWISRLILTSLGFK